MERGQKISKAWGFAKACNQLDNSSCTFYRVSIKGVDQTVQMCRLVCANIGSNGPFIFLENTHTIFFHSFFFQVEKFADHIQQNDQVFTGQDPTERSQNPLALTRLVYIHVHIFLTLSGLVKSFVGKTGSMLDSFNTTLVRFLVRRPRATSQTAYNF